MEIHLRLLILLYFEDYFIVNTDTFIKELPVLKKICKLTQQQLGDIAGVGRPLQILRVENMR